MVVRFYSSTAQETTLVGSITNVSATMTVTAVTGFPTSTPYSLAIDYGTATEELVTVTNTSGTLLTITRGFDGTTAIAHNAGAKVRHVSSAFDFATSRSHENASTDVHGLTGGAAIVSTTGTQTLTNKTLTSPVINNGTFNNIGPLTGWTTFTPTIQGDGGVPITGVPPINYGRYIKVGRMVKLHMGFQGSGAITVPGGAGAIITWNVPAAIAPLNQPAGMHITGTSMVNAIFSLLLGVSTYVNGYTGFRLLYPDSTGGNGLLKFFSGGDAVSGILVTHDIVYESAT